MRKMALIRRHLFSIYNFTAEFRKAHEKFNCILAPAYGLIVAEIVLDMVMAVYTLHSNNLVCGSIEPDFINFDGDDFKFTIEISSFDTRKLVI